MNNETTIPTAILDGKDHLSEQVLMAPSGIQQDFDYAKQFLISYSRSDDTYNTYRREVECFLQWAWLIKKISIKEIKRKIFEEYLAFTQDPPTSWCSKHHVARFVNSQGQRVPNTEWRPYILSKGKRKYSMSQSEVRLPFELNWVVT